MYLSGLSNLVCQETRQVSFYFKPAALIRYTLHRNDCLLQGISLLLQIKVPQATVLHAPNDLLTFLSEWLQHFQYLDVFTSSIENINGYKSYYIPARDFDTSIKDILLPIDPLMIVYVRHGSCRLDTNRIYLRTNRCCFSSVIVKRRDAEKRMVKERESPPKKIDPALSTENRIYLPQAKQNPPQTKENRIVLPQGK